MVLATAGNVENPNIQCYTNLCFKSLCATPVLGIFFNLFAQNVFSREFDRLCFVFPPSQYRSLADRVQLLQLSQLRFQYRLFSMISVSFSGAIIHILNLGTAGTIGCAAPLSIYSGYNAWKIYKNYKTTENLSEAVLQSQSALDQPFLEEVVAVNPLPQQQTQPLIMPDTAPAA